MKSINVSFTANLALFTKPQGTAFACAKNVSIRKTLQLFYAKNGSKKQLEKCDNSKIATILKIGKNGHRAKATAFAKSSLWVKNLKCKKHARDISTKHCS